MSGKAALTRVMQVPLKLRRPDDPDRNNAGHRDDFDVMDGNGRRVGRILGQAAPGRAIGWGLVGCRSPAAAQPRLRWHAR